MKSKLLLLSVFFTISFTSYGEKKKAVFAKKISKVEVFDSFSYPAKVISNSNSLVLAESQGVVQDLKFKLGQKVKKGQILVELKHTDPVYNYRPVKLRSQIDGVVSRIFVTEGSLLAKGEKVLMITDPEDQRIVIEVPARDLSYLKTGLEGSLKVNSNKAITVKIQGISPYVDPSSGSARAELTSEKKDLLAIGTLGKVEFKSNIHQAIVLPEHAIKYRGNKTFVNLINDESKVKRIEVSLGRKRRGIVEILDGLEENQTVVERVSGFLAEGAEVEIKNPEGEKEAKAKDSK